jgi:thiol-disulfide isomerase/thioredoxin
MQRGYFKKGLITGTIMGSVIGILLLSYIYYVSKRNIGQSEVANKSKYFTELNLTFKDLEGKVVDINQFRGKKVLVNFWGTWCAPCVKEMPNLQNTYNNKEIKANCVFLMISDEALKKIKAFKVKNGYNFVFVKTDQKLQSKIGVFPTTFVLDEQLQIIFKKVGSFNDEDMTKLRGLLSKKPEK